MEEGYESYRSHPPRLGDSEKLERARHLPAEDSCDRDPAVAHRRVGLLKDRMPVVELIEGLRQIERMARQSRELERFGGALRDLRQRRRFEKERPQVVLPVPPRRSRGDALLP